VRTPLAETLRIALRVERRLMLGQDEGIVDSESAELLAVGQEKAEVLPRQGHQLQRYRDAGLGHVILQSAGRQPEAGRAGPPSKSRSHGGKVSFCPHPLPVVIVGKPELCVPWRRPLTNKMGVAERAVTPPVSKTS
jgi:hypothetical protein